MTIGKSVSNVYSKAFAECKSLESVICMAVNPPSANSDAFENSYTEHVTLYVPDASVNSYKSVSIWNLFGAIKGVSEYDPDNQQPASQKAEINGIYYILIGKARTAEVTSSPNWYSGAITIPEIVEYKGFTYQVTHIGENAFSGCYKLSSIILPNSIQDIGKFAFQYCKNISSITIPDGVTIIRQGTFMGCSGLKSVKIPNTVISLEYQAFENCSVLESISLPPNVTGIGSVAGSCFHNCESLSSIVIPDKVTTIYSNNFYGCTNLKTITIGESVNKINERAFAECKSLESVICLAENVPMASSDAFENSYIELVTLYVPENSVDKYKAQEPWSKFGHINAFSGSIKYTLTYKVDGVVYKTVSYDYGATITPETEPTKEGYTFSGWSDIPSTMPAKDVTITGTFTINKYKLIYMVDGEVYKTYEIEYGTTITPEAEPTKEGFKFSGWSNIPSKMPAEDVVVTGTFTQEVEIKDNVSYEIDGDNVSVTHADNAKGEIKIEASVVINGQTYEVTSIAEGAFQGCTEVTSVEIPNTISTIGQNAFNGCSSLLVIKIGKAIKAIGSKAFANIATNAVRTRAEDTGLKVYCEAEIIPSAPADIFENSPIDKATLIVNDELVNVYKLVMPWNGFGSIIGITTDIRNIAIDADKAFIFDMQGNRIDNVRKGVNIIRTRDGKTKKVDLY